MRLQKFISAALSVTTALTLVGIGGGKALAAGRLRAASVTMSVVRSGLTSNHTIAFGVGSTTDVKVVEFKYRNTASSGDTKPDSLSFTSAAIGNVWVKGATDTSNWGLTADDSNGILTYTATTAATGLAGGNEIKIETQSIGNNVTNGSNPCDGITDSDTCWVRITTYTNADKAANHVIDTTTATYTVINPITMTATVDPILTFTITPIPSGSRPDAGMAQDTNAGSDTTSLPFGNLTLGQARVVAQNLTVLTNANSGYTVYNKFVGRTPGGADGGNELMTGTYSGNNIDPFPAGQGTGWMTDDATGGTNRSATWRTPDGTTSNTNTGWLGMRTNNGGNNVGSNFTVANTWAPPYVGSGLGRVVMFSDIPDNGGTPTTVSFKMQANAFQPADLYTGVTTYNVVASY